MYSLAWEKIFCQHKKYFVQADGRGINPEHYFLPVPQSEVLNSKCLPNRWVFTKEPDFRASFQLTNCHISSNLKIWIAIPFRSLGSPAPATVLSPWTKFTDVFLSGKSKGFHLSWFGFGCCSFQSWLNFPLSIGENGPWTTEGRILYNQLLWFPSLPTVEIKYFFSQAKILWKWGHFERAKLTLRMLPAYWKADIGKYKGGLDLSIQIV